MSTLGIIFALAVGWVGYRLIVKSEKNRKHYQHWSGITGTERKQDDYYLGYVVQFFVGLLMILGGIILLGMFS